MPLYNKAVERTGKIYGLLVVQRSGPDMNMPFFELGHFLKPWKCSELGSSEWVCGQCKRAWVRITLLPPSLVNWLLATSSRPPESDVELQTSTWARPLHPCRHLKALRPWRPSPPPPTSPHPSIPSQFVKGLMLHNSNSGVQCYLPRRTYIINTSKDHFVLLAWYQLQAARKSTNPLHGVKLGTKANVHNEQK